MKWSWELGATRIGVIVETITLRASGSGVDGVDGVDNDGVTLIGEWR